MSWGQKRLLVPPLWWGRFLEGACLPWEPSVELGPSPETGGVPASNMGCRIRLRALMNQLLTCRRVRFVWAAMCRFSSSVGYGCCNLKPLKTVSSRLQDGLLTTKCWNSQDRITLVACLGKTPRFCFLLPTRPVKSLSQSSAEPPGVVGAGDNCPTQKN